MCVSTPKHTCVHAYKTHMHRNTRVPVHIRRSHMRTHLHVCVQTHMHVYTYTTPCPCTQTQIPTYSYAHRHTRTYTPIHPEICAGAHTKHTWAHAYTHSLTLSQAGQGPQAPHLKAGKRASAPGRSQLMSARPRLGLSELRVGVSGPPSSLSPGHRQPPPQASSSLCSPPPSCPHPSKQPWESPGFGCKRMRRKGPPHPQTKHLLLIVCPSPPPLHSTALPSPSLSFPGCEMKRSFLGISRSPSASPPACTALALPTQAACFLEPSAGNTLSP